MKMKRLLALVLALAALVALTACGNSGVSKENGVTTYTFVDTPYNLSEKEVLEKMPPAETTLDPQSIYDSITYNEKLFYGEYEIYKLDSEFNKFCKNATPMTLEYSDSYGEIYESTLSTMPVGVRFGPTSVDMGRYVRDHEWAQLIFANLDGKYRTYVYCTYTVSGNTISFTPLDYLKRIDDEEYRTIGYDYTLGQDSLDFTFSFQGPKITLSNGQESVTLYGYYYSGDNNVNHRLGGYLAPNSPKLGAMDNFNASLYDDGSSSFYVAYDENSDFSSGFSYYGVIKLKDNGIIDLYWVDRDHEGNEFTNRHQFVYFGTYPSITLTDGKTFYYYTETYTTRQMALMGDGMSTEDLIEFESMSETDQQEIVAKKANLLNDLSNAFQEAGLNVTINHETGEIALDSAVLFGVNESNISPEGKEFLRSFLNVYTGVVFGDEYTDFVSKIMVEGHTDTSGSYDLNLSLSQARADSVLAFCLSEEAGIDPAYVESLTGTLEAVGYSYDKPVYDENGDVDMDASRRVSFRFVIKIGD